MRRKKRVIIALLTATIATMTAVPVFAAALQMERRMLLLHLRQRMAHGKHGWSNGRKKRGDWTIVSLSPGTNETEMNFSWYSESPNAVFNG